MYAPRAPGLVTWKTCHMADLMQMGHADGLQAGQKSDSWCQAAARTGMASGARTSTRCRRRYWTTRRCDACCKYLRATLRGQAILQSLRRQCFVREELL